jgi:soluble lytic murein transglycosylase-like protein
MPTKAGLGRLQNLQLGPKLDQWASRYGLDRALVYGLVSHESAFNPRAYRFESRLNDASRGLTQILYATAQGEGYGGAPDGLYDVDTNLHYGLSYLRRMLDRFNGYEPAALAAYNGGPGIVRADGSWSNTSYVNAVLAEWAYFAQSLGAWGWQPGAIPDPFAPTPTPGISIPSQQAGFSWLGILLVVGAVVGLSLLPRFRS